MNIAIVTLQESDNYGAVWQAYSLAEQLRLMGHRPSLVPWVPRTWKTKKGLSRLFSSRLEKTIRKLVAHVNHQKFKAFRNLNLYQGNPRRLPADGLIASGLQADAIVIGGDQVWNQGFAPQGSDDEKVLSARFGPGDLPRFSYAASVGHSISTDEQRSRLQWFASNMDCIGVRERSIKLALEQMGMHGDWNIDPTLLLPAGRFAELTSRFDAKGAPYVFCYNLPHASFPVAEEAAGVLARHTGSRITWCQPRRPSDSMGRTSLVQSPMQWLNLVSRAEHVVTNSFHGVAFSIVFHRPFIVIENKGSTSGMNDRLHSMLDRLGLSDRILSTSEEGAVLSAARAPVAWAKVEERVGAWRQESLQYLSDCLAKASRRRASCEA